MFNYITMAEAQQKLPELSKNMGEPAIITQNGEPVIVAMSMDQFASLAETLEILSDRQFLSELRDGIQQADAGQTISLDSLKLELGF